MTGSDTLITLAPEVVPRDVAATLVRVCAGHTADDGPAILAAMEAGLTGFTHLFENSTGRPIAERLGRQRSWE